MFLTFHHHGVVVFWIGVKCLWYSVDASVIGHIAIVHVSRPERLGKQEEYGVESMFLTSLHHGVVVSWIGVKCPWYRANAHVIGHITIVHISRPERLGKQEEYGV